MKNKHFTDETKGIFRKEIIEGGIELEVAMTEAAQKLSKQKKAFIVPQIYAIDSDKNLIEFELLKQVIPFRVPLNRSLRPFAEASNYNTIKKRMSYLGETLACIHNSESNFASIPKHPFPSNFFKPTSKEVYLHGDFTLQNILYNPRLDKLAIIDWSTPPTFDFQANWGPNLWDISILISSTFQYSSSTLFFSFLKRKRLVFSFLKGYQSNIVDKKKIDTGELKFFLRDYNLYKVNPGVKKNLTNRYSVFMLRKFINDLKKIQEIL